MRKQCENNKTPRKPFDATAEQRLTHLSLIDDWGRIANPLLADPMFWIGYIEKVGTGTEDIVNLCKDKGLQSPEYHQEEDFRVVIWRKKTGNDPEVIQNDPDNTQKDTRIEPELVLQAVLQTVPQAVLQTIIGSMTDNPKVTRKELADKLDVSVKTVGRYLKKLEAVVSYEGSGYSGHWKVMVPIESLRNQEGNKKGTKEEGE